MKSPSQKTLSDKAADREITFAQAINEALAEEMRRDPRVFIIGEDVAEAGTPFKVLSGLVKEFGTTACHRFAYFRSWYQLASASAPP